MLIVGMAGGTCSGKTTAVQKVMEVFPDEEVIVIPQASYYNDDADIPPEERQTINFDHPDSVEWALLTDHLKLLKKDQSVKMPIYSYLTCLRANDTNTIRLARVVLIAGILILTNPGLRKLLNVKVNVEADADDRLGRVINRDIIERGRSVLKVPEKYHDTAKSSYLQFIELSKRYTNIIIPRGGENEVGNEVLISIIEKQLLISKS
jgi:uridine kinase